MFDVQPFKPGDVKDDKYGVELGGDSYVLKSYGLYREAAAAYARRLHVRLAWAYIARPYAMIAHSSRRDIVLLSMSVGLQRRCWTSRPAAWHRSPRRPGAWPLASRRARSEPSLLSIERSKRGKPFKYHAR